MTVTVLSIFGKLKWKTSASKILAYTRQDKFIRPMQWERTLASVVLEDADAFEGIYSFCYSLSS